VTRIDVDRLKSTLNDGWQTAVLDVQAFRGQAIKLRFVTPWGWEHQLDLASMAFAVEAPDWTPADAGRVRIGTDAAVGAYGVIAGQETVLTSGEFRVPMTAQSMEFQYQGRILGNADGWATFGIQVLSGFNYEASTWAAGWFGGTQNEGWKLATLDLTPFRGRVIRLRFMNSWNNQETWIAGLSITTGIATQFVDRDSTSDANYLLLDGAGQNVTSAPFVVDTVQNVLHVKYQTGNRANGEHPMPVLVDVLSGQDFQITTRLNVLPNTPPIFGTLNDGWKTARFSLEGFQDDPIRLRFSNGDDNNHRTRIDQVYMLGSTQALATSADTSQCANRTLSDIWWKVNVDLSGDDGLIVRDATLGTRYMAKEISLPYGVISFKNKKGTILGTERFELKTKTDKGIKSELISCAVTTPVAYDRPEHHAAGDKLVITAKYLVTNFKTAPTAKLYVDQVYEFHPEVDEDAYEEDLACEPSNESNATDGFSHFSCARWKPIVRYEFIPTATVFLNSVTFAQRLHMTPDGQPLRGTMVIHDCAANNQGTNAEPCMFTSAPLDFPKLPLQINYAPPEDALNRPGVQLLNNTNSLDTELSFEAIRDGLSTRWDNIHATWSTGADLPIPLPPGCPECVHIHWRWDESFGPQFGDGYPQIENSTGAPGIPGVPMLEHRASTQNVRIYLVRHRPGEEDPGNVISLAGNESLASGVGHTMWYVATGFQNKDSFFAHGGFFSTHTPALVDIRITESYLLNEDDYGDVLFRVIPSGRIVDGPFLVMYKIPPGWSNVRVESNPPADPIGSFQGCEIEPSDTLVCGFNGVYTGVFLIRATPPTNRESKHTFTIWSPSPELNPSDNTVTIDTPK
jgi:hypothetical protein